MPTEHPAMVGKIQTSAMMERISTLMIVRILIPEYSQWERLESIYSFEFYGLSDVWGATRIRLYADGRVETSSLTGYAWTPIVMGATLKLSSGSKVFVLLHVGNLYDK